MNADQRLELARHFPLPRLDAAHDAIADGGPLARGPGAGPLVAVFRRAGVDYSLHRLRHYTGTDPRQASRASLLFTNYQRYIDEFIDYGLREIEAGRASRFIEPGGRVSEKGKEPSRPPLTKMPQMPGLSSGAGRRRRHHLGQYRRRPVQCQDGDRSPRGAAAACLADGRPLRAALRGQPATGRLCVGRMPICATIMCSTRLLPLAIPVPTIAEVQLALAQAVTQHHGLAGYRAERTLTHRDCRHHRRPQLGIALR